MGMYRYTVFYDSTRVSYDYGNYARKANAIRTAKKVWQHEKDAGIVGIKRIGVMDEKTQHIIWENGTLR